VLRAAVVALSRDLSVTQMRVLARLYAGPPPEALTSELARELDVSDPTVSDALGALRPSDLRVDCAQHAALP
jgi:DNA-binding MarR family transcriptional regulator